MAADGTWNVSLNTPQGAQAMTLEIATSGSTLTGKIAGGQLGSLDLSDGTVDGDNLTFKATLAQYNVTLDFKAKVDGDNISGEVSFGSYGSGNFTGTRA